MGNLIIIIVLVLALGWAGRYIFREKKKGKCIGCPAGSCKRCSACKTVFSANKECAIHKKG